MSGTAAAPATMQAVVLTGYGGPDVLQMQTVPAPVAGPEDIVVDVHATALNRADVLQRLGRYPPPEPRPACEIPGLEFAGIVAAVGAAVTRWRPGDRVFGLLPGGGYAEQIVTHESLALPVPAAMPLTEAAAVAEVFLTAYDALVRQAGLQAGETVLVHAGASGVGTAAIQLAEAFGAGRVLATVGSARKAAAVQRLGATPIVYRETDFVEAVREATGGAGAHVILDLVGGDYIPRNLQAAAPQGRIVVIGLLRGGRADVPLGLLLSKRLRLIGTVLRSRSVAEKADLTAAFARDVLPWLETGRVRPVLDKQYALADAAKAHAYLEQNESVGKVVLVVRD